jgi:ubiquinone biosynthesis protein Coq4
VYQIGEGWMLGRKARSLMPVRWEDYWESELDSLRTEYDLI